MKSSPRTPVKKVSYLIPRLVTWWSRKWRFHSTSLIENVYHYLKIFFNCTIINYNNQLYRKLKNVLYSNYKFQKSCQLCLQSHTKIALKSWTSHWEKILGTVTWYMFLKMSLTTFRGWIQAMVDPSVTKYCD